MAITWPVAVLSVAAVIDNPWGVCTQRAMAAGRILADVLHTRQQVRRWFSHVQRLAKSTICTWDFLQQHMNCACFRVMFVDFVRAMYRWFPCERHAPPLATSV